MRLMFSTSNNYSAGGMAGICSAMSCDWAHRSLESNGITSASQLDSPHGLSIAQGAYVIGHSRGDAIFSRYDLNVINHKTVTTGLPLSLAHAVSQQPAGHVLIGVYGNYGGHTMGARIDNGSAHFFDPNFGLYRGTSRVQLKSFLTEHLVRYYQGTTWGELWRVR